MKNIPAIDSFVIRFIRSGTRDDPPEYRGTVRHIQSNQERIFKRWEDVVAFIQLFVSIESGEQEDRRTK